MRKTMSFLLMAAMVCGFSFAITSCKDDDDSDNGGGTTPDEKRELTMDQVMQREAVASVLNQLTGESFSDTADVNFEDRTFEAVIGEVRNESRPSERSILVRKAALAEGYFQSLAGGASDLVKETADGYVIDLTNLDCHSTGRKQSLGTLTFHRGSGADNVGYADIDIACIPGLQRISYKTSEQWGENARFRSPIGYGEVFIGGNGRYWICVREANGRHTMQGGVLINMQPGKGDKWSYIISSGESWCAWCPSDHVLNGYFGTAILDYVDLCGDPDFATEKRRIMEKSFGSKVFPVGCVWSWDSDFEGWTLPSGHGPGFGTDNPVYCHTGWWPTTHGVIIVRDCTEGDYRTGHGWWRRWHVYCTRVNGDDDPEDERMADRNYYISDSSDLRDYTFYYTATDDFYNFPANSMIYTARGVTFNESIPSGFTKVDI